MFAWNDSCVKCEISGTNAQPIATVPCIFTRNGDGSMSQSWYLSHKPVVAVLFFLLISYYILIIISFSGKLIVLAFFISNIGINI